jgi:hypothetical protein
MIKAQQQKNNKDGSVTKTGVCNIICVNPQNDNLSY